MNTNPDAIKVLCYGDSNTHGQKPDRTGRHEPNVRWTGQLQNLLGDKYYVIEEGLGSRTTNLEYDRKPGRNGKTYLAPCLHSHDPLDIVMIMLGTNDLKIEYRRSSEAIADAISELIDAVGMYGETKTGKIPKIVIISPIEIDDQAPKFSELYTGSYDRESAVESKKLSKAIKNIAEEHEAIFLDAATVARAGEDGIHIDEISQKPLAELVAKTIKSLS